MRPSPIRHNLARLRLLLGFQQQEMADLALCSRELIKSVELGRTRLTERLAEHVWMATNVNLRWLYENDLKAPIIDLTGQPYTKKTFEDMLKQDAQFAGGLEAISRWTLGHQLARLFACYLAAEKKGTMNATLFRLRLGRALETLEGDFGWARDTYKDGALPEAFNTVIGGQYPILSTPNTRPGVWTQGGRKPKAG